MQNKNKITTLKSARRSKSSLHAEPKKTACLDNSSKSESTKYIYFSDEKCRAVLPRGTDGIDALAHRLRLQTLKPLLAPLSCLHLPRYHQNYQTNSTHQAPKDLRSSSNLKIYHSMCATKLASLAHSFPHACIFDNQGHRHHHRQAFLACFAMGLFCSLPPKHLLLNPSNQPKKKK